MSESHERLVAVGGYFDGKLMPPTLIGLGELRMPIHEQTTAEVIVDAPPTAEARYEQYARGEFTTYDRVFAVWIAKGLTYANVMERLLNRYCYERD